MTVPDQRLLKRYEDELADSARRLEYATGFARGGLQALTIINGGALVALFTLVGGEARLHFDFGALWITFAVFAVGLTANIASYLCAYLCQNYYYLVAYEQADRARALAFGAAPEQDSITANHANGVWAQLGAILAAIVALACFIGGCGTALYAVAP